MYFLTVYYKKDKGSVLIKFKQQQTQPVFEMGGHNHALE